MPAMHAVKISNGQHAPVRGLTEIMYAAYQLHVWLKTVKIVRVYLVQLATLTSDCTSSLKDPGNSFTQREIAGKSLRHRRFLWSKGCIRQQQAGRILRHHYVMKRC
ncbi:Antitoxin PhD (modular protein) [Klebsiella grimontii]|uniref:Antitoxin PhD (Modular protein) n=1 Tax=Klebsiella grimontii TaxID=2058152 RepID=A0A285AYC0_9ENTR|nr:Antitoxin PhD (modular protein) [Klebsiella grimontii]